MDISFNERQQTLVGIYVAFCSPDVNTYCEHKVYRRMPRSGYLTPIHPVGSTSARRHQTDEHETMWSDFIRITTKMTWATPHVLRLTACQVTACARHRACVLVPGSLKLDA